MPIKKNHFYLPVMMTYLDRFYLKTSFSLNKRRIFYRYDWHAAANQRLLFQIPKGFVGFQNNVKRAIDNGKFHGSLQN